MSTLELASDRLTGGLLCALGGVGMSVGAFLAWITATDPSQSLRRSAFQLGNGEAFAFYGPLCLVVGVFAIAIGVARLVARTTPSYLFHIATLSTLAVGILLVYRYPAVEGLVQQFHGQIVLASVVVGTGFWICCVGAFVPIVGEFLQWAITFNREFNIRLVYDLPWASRVRIGGLESLFTFDIREPCGAKAQWRGRATGTPLPTTAPFALITCQRHRGHQGPHLASANPVPFHRNRDFAWQWELGAPSALN